MVETAPEKPRIRVRSVVGTVLGAIGTGATIVGGGILMSFHKLTVDDHHTRTVAGVVPIVIGALMIVVSLIIGLMDGYDAYRWWRWRKDHPEERRQAETAAV